jgi:Fe-S cluster assembly protein SufD
VFFPHGEQHVDLISTVEHNVGNASSETVVKSAAIGRGQGRYVGNIRIAQHAQGSEAWLYDHALLLSPKAHIDSVPALEIAANDVKAYHGATVGAIDEEQIFYMTSRGIDRESAEKMIALGFFEPALERFPTQALRERLRAALEGKVRACSTRWTRNSNASLPIVRFCAKKPVAANAWYFSTRRRLRRSRSV